MLLHVDVNSQDPIIDSDWGWRDDSVEKALMAQFRGLVLGFLAFV